MYINDIPEGCRVEYKQVCPCCHMEQKILSQRNNFPEYETEIYLECQCGEFIEFVLPVN